MVKNGKYTNWFGLFHFHIYLKWGNFCHCKWKFKFQKAVLRRVYVLISNGLYLQSERDSQCAYGPLFTPLFPIRTLNEHFWPFTWCIFTLYPNNFDIIKGIKLTTFLILLVTPWKKLVAAALRERGWGGLEICHVITYSTVFKQQIYCSFLRMEVRVCVEGGLGVVDVIIIWPLMLKLPLIKK